MKTLHETASEYSMARAPVRSLEPQFVLGSIYDAFLAGAACMAELFAQGTALRIERTPVWYTVNDEEEEFKSTDTWTLLAFSAVEAIKQVAEECYRGALPHLKCRPATVKEIAKYLESKK